MRFFRLAAVALSVLTSSACSHGDDIGREGVAHGVGSQASTTTSSADESGAPNDGFVPAHDADAMEQPGGKQIVGHLEAGKSYPLLKHGGPGHNWCKVKTGDATGWILCSEGTAKGSPPPTPPTSSSTGAATSSENGAGFAYYVLTLSWSPAFCETPAGQRSTEQCNGSRHYAFVVHGLWPQNETGWPEACATTASAPTHDLVSKMLDLMPSEKLIEHEWEKHGTCSGLPADAYFAKIRTAYQSIHIPDAYVAPAQAFTTDLDSIVSAFTEKNPGLAKDDMAVECKRELDEVRICLDKNLKPRNCGSDVRNACKGSVTVPPLR